MNGTAKLTGVRTDPCLPVSAEFVGCKDFLLTESTLLEVYCKHVKVQGRPPRSLRAVSRHSKIKSKWSCARHILANLMLSKVSPVTQVNFADDSSWAAYDCNVYCANAELEISIADV